MAEVTGVKEREILRNRAGEGASVGVGAAGKWVMKRFSTGHAEATSSKTLSTSRGRKGPTPPG